MASLVVLVVVVVEVGVRLEEALTQEIAQLRQRVAHVEMVNSERRRDLVLLTQHVNRSVPWSKYCQLTSTQRNSLQKNLDYRSVVGPSS